MSLSEDQVAEFLDNNEDFARNWFIDNANREWVDEWRKKRRSMNILKHQFNQIPVHEPAAPTSNLPLNSQTTGSGQRLGDDNLIGKHVPRGSITSEMFMRHIEQGNSPLTRAPSLNRSRRLATLSERDLFMELIRDIAKELNVDALCFKILSNVNILTKSDRSSMFLARGKPDNRYLISKLFDVTADSTLEQSIHGPSEAIRVPFGVGIAGHVALTKEIVNIKDCYQDPRFNKEIDRKTGYETHGMLCMPILNFEDEVIGVAQIINKRDKSQAFTTQDERVFADYLQFCGIGLTNAQLFQKSVEEYKRNLVLLRLARKIFREQQDMERLVTTTMQESMTMLDCQRCMVYLLNSDKYRKSREIEMTKVFEITAIPEIVINDDDTCANKSYTVEPEKVPSPIMLLAKQVIEEDKILTIEDFEYEQNEVVVFEDERNLYNIMCAPIRDGEGRTIGVTQLMNKTNEQPFTEVDVNTFETFSIFVGLGIHNCHMYENVCRLMMKQKVAFEVLSYHATAVKDEVETLMALPIPEIAEYQIDRWEFDDRPLTDYDTLRICVRMFKDVGCIENCSVPIEVLSRWLCSVKKNYRDVTYHNWRHAFNVTQSMFTLLQTADVKSYFNKLEIFGLMVSCLCHDMDHRGTNNSFQSKIESPLAKLYTTSTMENHHFDQCVMVLNAEGNNIFQSLSHSDYRKIIVLIRNAILSTDLAVYFKKRGSFKEAIENAGSSKIYWQQNERKELLRGMLMTACDVAATTKPWEIQYEVAHLVAAEFFEQGDIEKEKLKQKPMPMMDRDKKDDIPAMQVDFIDSICIPLYEILYKFHGPIKPMYDGCLENRNNWQKLADEVKKTRGK